MFHGVRQKHFIKQWREFRDLTMEQLAERMETTKASVSRIEAGEQPYTEDSLHAIAVALNCTPADLLTSAPADKEKTVSVFDLPVEDAEEVKKVIRVLESILARKA